MSIGTAPLLDLKYCGIRVVGLGSRLEAAGCWLEGGTDMAVTTGEGGFARCAKRGLCTVVWRCTLLDQWVSYGHSSSSP